MKILVISDTHNYIRNVINVLTNFNDIEVVFHLGDLYSDCREIMNKFLGLEFHWVTGNNDFMEVSKNENLVILMGKKFYLTHGHNHKVYSGVEHLYYSAKEKEANFAIFGHTHSAYLEDFEDIVVLNPGSISCPRGTSIPSFAIIEIIEEKATTTIYGIYDDEYKVICKI